MFKKKYQEAIKPKTEIDYKLAVILNPICPPTLVRTEIIAKIKALVREEIIKEIDLLDNKLYDINKIDWGIPTKWSNEKYKGKNYADLWTPNEAIHECIRSRLGEIRSLYE